MNIKKFGKRLIKINRLFDGIQEDGEISSIEKDLLLSYLRDAYEMAMEVEDSNIKPSNKKQYKEPEVHVPARKVIKENIVENIASVETSTPVVTTPVSNDHTPVENKDTPVAVFSNLDIDPLLKEIFDSEIGTDLSDKLAMGPIKDMNKSMGINERIFTVKELFGNDNELFTSILDRINKLSNYEEAKNYLATGIAKDQDWASESKIKKAEKFIRLVKRRYL